VGDGPGADVNTVVVAHSASLPFPHRSPLRLSTVPIMFSCMQATAFDMEAPLDERRIIVRYGDDGVEMVELPWGLCPKEPGNLPLMLVRAEGRKCPSHRCLVPASEFLISRHGQRYRFS